MAAFQSFRPRRADATREALLFEAEPDRISGGIGQVSQTVLHAQDEEDRGVDAHRYTGVALFDPRERIAVDEGAFGHERHGQSPAPPGGRDIQPQLLQCTPHPEGKGLSGA